MVNEPSTSSSIRRGWRWPRSARQARAHAILAAVVLWILAIVTLVAGADNRSIAGPLKGADFSQFYTMGSLVRAHQTASLYDFAALHRAQVTLIPESESVLYLPVYPPQAALLFAPFSTFSYRTALMVWIFITIALFAVIVRSAWLPVARYLDDPVLVIAAAAAFPPFWSLVAHGQNTIVILAGFWAGWLALERERPFLAGLAFGLLLLKPQFAIPLVVVVLACGEWAMLIGALTSVAIQAGSAWLLLGWSVLKAYAAFIPAILRNAELLEPKPYQTHSLKSLTELMPSWIGWPLWGLLAAGVLVYTVRAWRSNTTVRVRLGVVIFASVLVNPHLLIYDATILVLPLIWIGAYAQEHSRPEDAWTFWTIVYWMFVALLAPTAFAIKVQVSVLLMIWLLVRSAPLLVGRGAPGPNPAQRTVAVG
jgi:glycosyl transferase family 87